MPEIRPRCCRVPQCDRRSESFHAEAVATKKLDTASVGNHSHISEKKNVFPRQMLMHDRMQGSA
jgi:hypothetical protein